MNKIYTVIGDPHITHKSLEKAAELFEVIEDLGNPTIILGDVLDTKEIIRGKCLNYIFKRLKESKQDFIILVGNHDYFNLECKDHSLEVLKELPNVTIVDKPVVINNILFMPYINTCEEFTKEAEKFPDIDVLFMHQGVSGHDYGNGFIADGTGNGELPESALNGFKTVISGHFHKYMSSGNLTFLGTPFSHSFGETDQTKYIAEYDSETQELGLFETPFPRHRTIELNCDKNEIITKEDIKEDYIRVILRGSEENIKVFDKTRLEGVKYIERPIEEESDILLNETESNEKIFETWAKEIKNLDPDTTRLGLDILNQSN